MNCCPGVVHSIAVSIVNLAAPSEDPAYQPANNPASEGDLSSTQNAPAQNAPAQNASAQSNNDGGIQTEEDAPPANTPVAAANTPVAAANNPVAEAHGPRGWWAVFASTYITIFLAEIGDKTQLTTLLMSAKSHKPWLVFAGAGTALVCTSLLGVLLGRWLATRISTRFLEIGAGVTLLIISAGLGWDIFQTL